MSPISYECVGSPFESARGSGPYFSLRNKSSIVSVSGSRAMKSRLVWPSINVAVSSFPSTVNLIFIRFGRVGSRSTADPGAPLALAPQAAEIKAIARATKAMRFIVAYLLSVDGLSQRFTSPAARSFAPVARTVPSVLGRSTPSRLQQRLNGAAFIHRAVALGHLLQRQRQIEDLAGVDLPVQHQLDQLGQVAPHGRGAAVKVNVGEEQLRAVEFHLVRDADVGDVPALTRAVDGGLPIQLAKSMDDDPDTIKAKSDYLESLNQKL